MSRLWRCNVDARTSRENDGEIAGMECRIDHAAFISLPRRAGLVGAQEAEVFDPRRVACVGARSAQSLFAYPLYEFELIFDGLASGAALSGSRREHPAKPDGTLSAMQGQFGTFLYTDPTDNTACGAGVGTGDGTTTTFTFLRALGGFIEPVAWVTAVANVYLNGVRKHPAGPVASRIRSPLRRRRASGAVITADFSYAFVAAFSTIKMISRISCAGFGRCKR